MQVLHYRVNFAQIVRTWPNWVSCEGKACGPAVGSSWMMTFLKSPDSKAWQTEPHNLIILDDKIAIWSSDNRMIISSSDGWTTIWSPWISIWPCNDWMEQWIWHDHKRSKSEDWTTTWSYDEWMTMWWSQITIRAFRDWKTIWSTVQWRAILSSYNW